MSAGGNRTDRYLDPPTADNFHNSGHADRFTGKVEFRPTDPTSSARSLSINGSSFEVANRPGRAGAGRRCHADPQ